MLKIQRYNDVAAFYAQTRAFLAQQEAENHLPLGILNGLLNGEFMENPPYLALAKDDEAIIGVAFQTPPHHACLSSPFDARAIPALVDDLRAFNPSLTGLIAPKGVGEAFCQRWRHGNDCSYQLAMAQRIYKLSAVIPPRPVAGRMRSATLSDRPRVLAWLAAFSHDTHANDDPDAIQQSAERFLNAPPHMRGLVFWEVDGETVSMAGYAGPTPHGMRVNAVYTPPPYRGKGYASACVAALSQRLLNEGRQFCFLFTDLANPTSNHIYQAIGYQPVFDIDVFRFHYRISTFVDKS